LNLYKDYVTNLSAEKTNCVPTIKMLVAIVIIVTSGMLTVGWQIKPGYATIPAISVVTAPRSVAVNLNINTGYVSNNRSSSVSVINGLTDTVITTVHVGSYTARD
jgi:YVTN family beta-propeller protein